MSTESSDNELIIHVVCHTHDDPGWLWTLDDYYMGTDHCKFSVKRILDNMVVSLSNKNDRKFSYVEMSFFTRWYHKQTEEIKQKVKNFIKEVDSNELILPTTYEVSYTDIDNYTKFNQFLSKKKLKYPIMLKFDGPDTKYDHLQINLISDKGLKNFISYFRSFSASDDKKKIKVIVQQFIQHGGYLIKLYRIKKTNYIYYRPSLPDIKEDMMNKCQEYKKGFFKFETKDMGTQKFKDFWQRMNGENNNFKDYVNERFLGKVAAQYADTYGDSLVGLDFIMDVSRGIYYLIDINPFPAYSELYNEMNQVFADHFSIGINEARKRIINI